MGTTNEPSGTPSFFYPTLVLFGKANDDSPRPLRGEDLTQ